MTLKEKFLNIKYLNELSNDEIVELRNKLDNAILRNENYEVIYQISVQLDDLIAKYYRNSKLKATNS